MRGRPPSQQGSGFTLVELLVVMAIIAVLAALVFPALGHVRLQAYAVQSSQNLRQLVAANVAYASDQGSYAPADDRWNNRRWHGARTSSGGAFDPTKGFLAGYLGKSGAVIIDPLFRTMIQGAKSFEDGTGGYGYNATYIGGTPAWTWNGDGTRVSARPAQIARPASTIMFATTAYAVAAGVQEYPYAEPPFWDFGAGPSASRPSPTVHFRFRGQAIVGWCDGHVSMEPKVERTAGSNPNLGDAEAQNLGWFGPEANNGFWNPDRP